MAWNDKRNGGSDSNFDMYQYVTDRIVAALENGTAPWVRPWKHVAGSQVIGGYPSNLVSKKPYKGINIFLLWLTSMEHGYTDTRWCTFNAIKNVGGHVRKGEHSTLIVFWKFIDRSQTVTTKNDDGDEITETRMGKVPLIRYYRVFNAEQCELPERYKLKTEESQEEQTDGRIPEVEEFISGTGADIVYGGDRACYTPLTDRIAVPNLSSFDSPEAFYATNFHELTHWTGKKERTDRPLINRFGDEAYAFEELIAEMGSAFLCAHFGVEGQLQHENYVGNWIKILKDNKYAVFTASSKARTATEWMLKKVYGNDVVKDQSEDAE